jgi:hypothetical protein
MTALGFGCLVQEKGRRTLGVTSGTGKFSKSHFLRELTVSAGRPLVREADYTPNRRERRFFRTYPGLTRFPDSRFFVQLPDTVRPEPVNDRIDLFAN